MIYKNMLLINWYFKKQSTIETSVFGTEFAAMKKGIETLCAICYKLRMMGIPISGGLYVYGDKKKCNAIAYDAIHESVAMGEAFTGHIRSEKIQLTY